MKLRIMTTVLGLLIVGGFAVAQTTAGQDMKTAGAETKDEAKHVGKATKKTAKTTKRKTKHAIHKATQ